MFLADYFDDGYFDVEYWGSFLLAPSWDASDSVSGSWTGEASEAGSWTAQDAVSTTWNTEQ